ncbi:MAG: glycosyltransferase family 2 protein [Anaerolineales bacterium]
MQPFLSIIIPAYNEERRISSTLETVLSFLEKQEYDSEIIVVENGSQDRTAEIVREYQREHPCLHLLHETRAGKGLAVRRGMLEAKGSYRFICDADLSMPIEEVRHFIPPQLETFDIAIASREAPGAVRYDEPVYRHFVGRGFNLLVRLFTGLNLQDTQCGFKCFRAEVVDELFHQQVIDGWTFDVEVLFLAQRRGYTIVEVPVPWYFHPGSRVRIVQDTFTMFCDLIRIRLNAIRGVYAPD